MRDIRHKIERPSTIVIVSPVADLVFMVIVLMQLYEPPVCTGTVAHTSSYPDVREPEFFNNLPIRIIIHVMV